MTDTVTAVYKGVPKDVSTRDPKDIIHNGKFDAPFMAEIQEIEQSVQDLRMKMSRELDKWAAVKTEARDAGDNNAFDRANREIDGIYEALAKLRGVAE